MTKTYKVGLDVIQIEKEIREAVTMPDNNPDFFKYIEEGKAFKSKRIEEASHVLIFENEDLFFNELIDIYESYAEDLCFVGTRINISDFQKKFLLGELSMTVHTIERLRLLTI